MKEFKGTKGKWKATAVVTPTQSFFAVNTEYNERICKLYGRTEQFTQSQANALLISKAPELLVMLHKITVARRNGQEIPLMEIENLIKSATQVEG